MKQNTTGFTLVEMLVTLAIFAIVIGFVVTGFQNFANYKRYDYAIASLETALREAKTAAQGSVDGEAHGVKLTSNSVTLFTGSTYNAGDPDNQVTTLPDVQLVFSLTGGTDEIVFGELNGLPSATGTIDVVGTSHEATTTVTITGTGVIQ